MGTTRKETPLLRLDHVILAVASVEDAAKAWRDAIGATVGEVATSEALYPGASTRTASVRVGSSRIVLCEPAGDGDAVREFLRRRGPGVFGLAINVADYRAAASQARSAGAVVLEDEATRTAWIGPGDANGVHLGLCEGLDPGARESAGPFEAFNYVVVAVRSRDEAASSWVKMLGAEGKKYLDLPDEGMRRMHFDLGDGSCWIALVEPLGDNSYQRKFLATHSEGVFEIAIQVPDGHGLARALRDHGVTIIGGVDGDGQVFLHPRATHGLLLELTTRGTHRAEDD